MKNHFKIFVILVSILLIQSCKVKDYYSSSQPVTHEIWNTLLKDHVTEAGHVNYKGFIADSIKFNKYIELLKSNHPNEKNWSEDERLAYWLNAYNAFTAKLIIDNYPVKSIKDIKNGIPFVNTVWDIKFIQIEGATYDLNNIEHGIIRKKFNDPRIHFAANCASISCPRLRNEAYIANRLDEQLDDQARYFMANQVKNIMTPDKLQLSKLFKWYKGDFTKGRKLIEFLNLYAPVQINKDAKIEHLDYLWELNGE